MARRQSPLPADAALLSAAMRHLRDAAHLGDAAGAHPSFDQAYHLAGFGPECARKAAIAASWVNKPLGHDLGDKAEWALRLALDLEPAAARYDVQAWETAYPALAKWSPERWYEATGTYDPRDVDRLLREAWGAVTEILAALWADGRLSLDTLR